jgi:hypothetical protein
VGLLDGLSRLLELLSNCFNVTLGEKLLDHLKQFSDLESIAKMRLEAANDKTPGAKIKPEVTKHCCRTS